MTTGGKNRKMTGRKEGLGDLGTGRREDGVKERNGGHGVREQESMK